MQKKKEGKVSGSRICKVIHMKKVSWRQNFFLCLGLLVQLFLLVDCTKKSELRRSIPKSSNGEEPPSSSQLRLLIQDRYVVMDNGLLQVTLSNPQGSVTNISYNGTNNLLEYRNEEDNRGYWDLVWNPANSSGKGTFNKILGTSFKVIMEDENQIELSFTTTWDYSVGDKSVPLNIDKRFVMLQASSGFYSYAIYKHLEGWPDFNMEETRIAFKLRKDWFHYMAISDHRQRIMPMPEDRATGQPLAYPEAVILTNPTNPELKGEVDDKYQYSCENQESRVHGWISFDPPIGFWMINPSDEFRTGGPVKQDLTSHVGPTTLSMFISLHYAGEDLSMKVRDREHWKKVFGPVYIYLNSAFDDEHVLSLWDDAKNQMLTEVQNWPYSFPASDDFLSYDQRGIVTGQLFIRDRFVEEEDIPADSAYLGLAPPGDAGSWQTEHKGYQFWTRADSDGSFLINDVRPGDYNLYGWMPGFIGDYKYDVNITINPGSNLSLGHIIYEPPRHGPTLWEIGIPDRSAAEFYVPDPKPEYINRLYLSNPTSNDKVAAPVDKFRQYGLWERYAELYPLQDLVYTVGLSDYSKDWFFAHFNRNIGNNTFQSTTWRIIFQLDNMDRNLNKTYMLQLALASASNCELQVRFNIPDVDPPHFTTKLIGRDNAIARHGIHGLYWLYNIEIQSDWLVIGENVIFLTQSRHLSPFQGVMYDYIRLEGPSS
ncbi:probable rhamnogalacturonate lyase B [Telopea speciosissima]|uniref:probable rhamnogalacturonate lyase B n=1 Tax=Telopea speciosissima TaxID=54955 RepID=UPI001CC40D64|nr:probable rhamnogalacturonate lyase B [Telopea speciosissima]